MPHTLPSISMTIPALSTERATSPLPPIGHDISRPPSASTASDPRGSHHGSEHGGEKVTLPALSTLANVASQGNPVQQRCVAGVHLGFSAQDEGYIGRVLTKHSQPQNNTQPPSYSNASPTPTSVAGQGNVPPVCQNCQTSTTPLWRRDEAGSVLCNACGLFLKLHGRPRPISLKTDVIKSRNRVKSSAHTGRRKMQFGQAPLQHPHQMQHPDLSTPPPHPSYRRVSDQHMSAYSDRSASPISRAGTPASLHPHHTYPSHSHTAPPLTHHLFDPHHARSPSPLPGMPPAYHSAPNTIGYRGTSPRPMGPTLPLPVPMVNHQLRSPSLAPTNIGAPGQGPAVSELQTRVSELEVINSLYKSKVQELESVHERDVAIIQNLQRELDEMRSRDCRHDRQPLSERPTEYPRQVPQEPASEPMNYATMTGSMKRRRGRTLEKAAEESKPYDNKRRATGEYSHPHPQVHPLHHSHPHPHQHQHPHSHSPHPQAGPPPAPVHA